VIKHVVQHKSQGIPQQVTVIFDTMKLAKLVGFIVLERLVANYVTVLALDVLIPMVCHCVLECPPQAMVQQAVLLQQAVLQRQEQHQPPVPLVLFRVQTSPDQNAVQRHNLA